MSTLVVLALGSIIFLSVVVIVSALMLRSRWDKLGDSDPSHPSKQ
jgi:hypothetical protein